MKKISFAVIFCCAALPVFSQKISGVVIFPFETPERGVSANDAASIRKQIIDEITSWGSIIVLEESEAESADFYVLGKITLDNGMAALTGTTYDAKTDKPLNSYREQAANMSALSGRVFSFCTRMAESIPLPNLLEGKWMSILDVNGGSLTCIVEFKPDRTVSIERYDTGEYSRDNALIYQGFGAGTYTYNPQARGIMTIEGSGGAVRESPVDGSISLSLTLEDTLLPYNSLNTGRVRLAFGSNNDSFELLNAGLPCGSGSEGPSIHPDRTFAYIHFTRIQ
jgi:hypothetical protein